MHKLDVIHCHIAINENSVNSDFEDHYLCDVVYLSYPEYHQQ